MLAQATEWRSDRLLFHRRGVLRPVPPRDEERPQDDRRAHEGSDKLSAGFRNRKPVEDGMEENNHEQAAACAVVEPGKDHRREDNGYEENRKAEDTHLNIGVAEEKRRQMSAGPQHGQDQRRSRGGANPNGCGLDNSLCPPAIAIDRYSFE